MTVFDQAFRIVVGEEGGFTTNPADPGNWTGGACGRGECRGTRYGVSAAAYPDIGIATLTLDAARAIYRRDYWDRVQGDLLPPPLALLVFDAAVNNGVGRAVRWLQQASGVPPDGVMGAHTLAAVAALHARARWGLKRVAVVDFDVHHGNGTQDIFQDDPDLMYVSSHQYPCYPGTGSAGERGVDGNVLNLPLPPGTAGPGFRAAWERMGLPALHDFKPELLIVSAGFDAHKLDPLADLCLETEDFGWMTDQLLAVADAHCGGRLVSILEGGYDLHALAASAALHVRRLMRQ